MSRELRGLRKGWDRLPSKISVPSGYSREENLSMGLCRGKREKDRNTKREREREYPNSMLFCVNEFFANWNHNVFFPRDINV